MLNLENISVSTDKKIILDNFKYSFGKGIYAILGPNGSGKSTLAKAIMGLTKYEGKISFEKQNIDKLSINERAKLGIFQLFQHTPHLPGISLLDIAKTIFKDKKQMDILDLVEAASLKVGLKEEYITKPLDKTWSGGELKKAEIVQMLLLKPKIVISDEIDAGVDIDSLEKIISIIESSGIETIIFISHIPSTLERIKPDQVLILKTGKLVANGGKDLIEKIKKQGYEGF